MAATDIVNFSPRPRCHTIQSCSLRFRLFKYFSCNCLFVMTVTPSRNMGPTSNGRGGEGKEGRRQWRSNRVCNAHGPDAVGGPKFTRRCSFSSNVDCIRINLENIH